MKNLDEKKLILIKKLIGLGSAILCVLLMLFKFIKYTSSSLLLSGGSITWSAKTSLFTFLFNGDYTLLDGRISTLRDVFPFSYVVMWMTFIISLISIVILSVGIFTKKNLVSKIGSYALIAGILLLTLLSFNRYEASKTLRYLDCFSPTYLLILFISFIGVLSTHTLKDKKEKQ